MTAQATIDTLRAKSAQMEARAGTLVPDVVVVPPVPLPPPLQTPTIVRTPVNVAAMVTLRRQFTRSDPRYDRNDQHWTLKTTAINEPLDCCQFGPGTRKAFVYPKYALLINGTARAWASPAPGAVAAINLTGALGNETDTATAISQVVGYDANGVEQERYQPYPFAIDRNGQAKNDLNFVVQNGTYVWSHAAGPPEHHYAIIPKATGLLDYPCPLPERRAVIPFSHELPPVQLARVNLVPSTDATDENWYLPSTTKDGVVVTANQQRYSQALFLDDKFPRVQVLDGERGVCKQPFPLEVLGGREGHGYGCGPWSIYRFEFTGACRTLIGLVYRSKLDASYHQSPPTSVLDPRLVVVGDWDPSIPVEERYPSESWFVLFDPRSVLLDFTATPDSITGEHPHLAYQLPSGEWIYGPRYFVGSKHGGGQVLEVRTGGGTNGTSRLDPHKVRVWIQTGTDVWGGCNLDTDNTFAMAEREESRVAEWSMDAPNTKVRDLLYSPAAKSVGTARKVGTDSRRRWKYSRGHSITTARTHDVCGSESLRYLPALDELSVGSLAQAEVRAFKLAALRAGDRSYTVIARPDCNMENVGSFWVNHGRSDGTFYALGTTFTTTFTNKSGGYPQVFRRDGSKIPWRPLGNAHGVVRGPGGQWNDSHYPICVSMVKEGRQYVSDSGGGGLSYHCKADAYDGPLPTTQEYAELEDGWFDYRRDGHNIVHGPYVTSQTGPLPWGKSANMDAWFEHLWHVRP